MECFCFRYRDESKLCDGAQPFRNVSVRQRHVASTLCTASSFKLTVQCSLFFLTSEYPQRVSELSDKVSRLEQQLETEIQQKRESVKKFLDMDLKLVDLEQQLETEIKQREEAVEKLQCMDIKVVDLEKRLEENSQMATDNESQVCFCSSVLTM